MDPTAWKLEVERVAPKLRILLNADAKDWRSHLEEVGQHTKVRLWQWKAKLSGAARLASSHLDICAHAV